MRRTAVLTATILLAAAGLTACTEEQAYCVDLAGFAAAATNVDPQVPADYAKLLDDAKKLQESAPAEVKDDWKVVAAFAEKAQQAGTNEIELARLSRQLGAVTTAYKAIATQAKDACKVEIPNLS
ncbi:hypothetical protein [Kribbella sp. CA-293567]|uniref:hypothetical protein n=1 Tax=Kribbella sp. CA-293567 TaxID=3002436 RepID=UPI0022DE73EE|nr:hypothetical protein [Kribbella sp. CA-293567]WBQ08064.1 hypothetical protein OX958_14955 [Kribbella sp. CA-293567]